MKSVISFPTRDPKCRKWGDPKWRGNCSGFVQDELIKQYNLHQKDGALFVDACKGSDTSGDVCREYPNIEYVGLDLHEGFDFTSQMITDHLPREADMVFTHPPYADMVKYSGHVYGLEEDSRDLSQGSIPEFLGKCQVMLLNQREATKAGGVFTTLIGDYRRSGAFYSFQADLVSMMPKSELKSVVIKMQHNCLSDSRNYSRMKHPAMVHEYLLIWEKGRANLYQVCWSMASQAKAVLNRSWRSCVRLALMKLGGTAPLADIYRKVEEVAGDKLATNPTFQATVRKTLQQAFERVDRGVWALPSEA